MSTVTIPTPNATASYVVSITTGQWSGSGNDRYITVQGGNISANSQLLPWYDNASQSLLNGPVWVVPSNGQFTIHTTAIPAGTVTIAVMVAGIVGEAQYQVLADVYSKAQTDEKIQQSTANNLGTSTDLSSYTPGNLFTLPNDGYIVYNTPANGYLGFRVYGASNNYFSLLPSGDVSGSLFLRKGMRIDVRTISTGTSIAFYPLII